VTGEILFIIQMNDTCVRCNENIFPVIRIYVLETGEDLTGQFRKIGDRRRIFFRCKIYNTYFFARTKPDIPVRIFIQVLNGHATEDGRQLRRRNKSFFGGVKFKDAFLGSKYYPVLYAEYIVSK